MKLRLGAAVLAGVLAPLTAVTAPSPATAGVDTNPPAEGSCHDLTLREAFRPADPDPPVGCRRTHTSVTTNVLVLAAPPPDWGADRFVQRVSERCARGNLAYFSGRAKVVQLSAVSQWIFFPTRAQREAGAAWVRCDVAIDRGRGLKVLRDRPFPALRAPLGNHVARCRKGPENFLVTTCDQAHRYRAVRALKYPGRTYPGQRRMIRWTVNHCRDALGRSFGFYEAATSYKWRTGYRFSICFRRTRN